MKKPFLPPPRRSSARPLGSLPGPKSEAVARSACLALAGVAVSAALFAWVLTQMDASWTRRDHLVFGLVAAMGFAWPGWLVGLVEWRPLRATSAVVIFGVACILVCDGLQTMPLRADGLSAEVVAWMLVPAIVAPAAAVLGHLARGKPVAAVVGSIALIVASLAVGQI